MWGMKGSLTEHLFRQIVGEDGNHINLLDVLRRVQMDKGQRQVTVAALQLPFTGLKRRLQVLELEPEQCLRLSGSSYKLLFTFSGSAMVGNQRLTPGSLMLVEGAATVVAQSTIVLVLLDSG